MEPANQQRCRELAEQARDPLERLQAETPTAISGRITGVSGDVITITSITQTTASPQVLDQAAALLGQEAIVQIVFDDTVIARHIILHPDAAHRKSANRQPAHTTGILKQTADTPAGWCPIKQSKPLPDKQQQILEFILRFSETHPYAPSIWDIQAGCQISSSSVTNYHLHHLERAGLLPRGRTSPAASASLKRGAAGLPTARKRPNITLTGVSVCRLPRRRRFRGK